MGLIRGRSLRQKFPLLVSALTAGSLVIAGSLAYIEVRGAARAAAEARLQSVAVQIVDLSGAGFEARAELEAELAESPALLRALSGAPVDSGALAELLSPLRTGADAELPLMLVARGGHAVFSVGAPPDGRDPDPDPLLDSIPRYGFFREVGGQILYWHSFPVPGGDGEPLGWIAQRRRIGNPQTGGVIESLVGSGIAISLGQEADSVWIDLGGALEEAPPQRVVLEAPFTYSSRDGEEVLAHAERLEETGWVLLLQMPMRRVLGRARVFLNQGLGVGVVLVLMTVLIAWLASRRLTGPLQELAVAAGHIAAGDYHRRVEPEGEDELASLAGAFNSMAEQVASSDEALRRRLEEARALAGRLEEANVRAEHSREEAQEASRAKSEFLATMSHEIRTPINAVIGYTSLLEQGIPDPPTEAQLEYLRRIERSSRLLISLVDDVLDLSRIESGRLRLEIGVGSAQEAILAAVAALEPEAVRKKISLTTRCPDGPRFHGDLQRVQQILLNLLSNAVKFTNEGGSVSVGCSLVDHAPDGAASDGERWLRVDVEDTGVGIDEGMIARLFEPFVQGTAGFTREHGGAGLGLAISRRLASMMSGEITVESVPGEGSRFTLWLVAAEESEPGA